MKGNQIVNIPIRIQNHIFTQSWVKDYLHYSIVCDNFGALITGRRSLCRSRVHLIDDTDSELILVVSTCYILLLKLLINTGELCEFIAFCANYYFLFVEWMCFKLQKQYYIIMSLYLFLSPLNCLFHFYIFLCYILFYGSSANIKINWIFCVIKVSVDDIDALKYEF